MDKREGVGKRFGEFVKAMRAEKRITLREFCKRTGVDPGNYSRVERGLLPPPQDSETLQKYAIGLEIKDGSEKGQMLFDLAAVGRGIIPPDIMSDKDVVKHLPLFFRTLRRKKPTVKQMKWLVDKLKED